MDDLCPAVPKGVALAQRSWHPTRRTGRQRDGGLVKVGGLWLVGCGWLISFNNNNRGDIPTKTDWLVGGWLVGWWVISKNDCRVSKVNRT